MEKRSILPISEVLPDILSSLDSNSNLALIAPPGAGKTTLVPLALLDANWRNGKRILVLEPRRLAARSAAARMASLLGESIGQRVGYRVRFDTKVSNDTVIEVVTEGVFSRILSDDPGLETVGAVLFDEFHERSLDADLALALCLDLQSALREDLRLIAMSATLDGGAVAELMEANIVESAGRAFPVEIEYRERGAREAIEGAVTQAILQVLSTENSGGLLIFLPGTREIHRVLENLTPKTPKNTGVFPLYGALSPRQQDEAIAPPKPGERKIVLATAIAETSLTIEGIDTVIDSGLSRQPVFEPATGLTRLQTVRASQAAVTQRAGRAGRLGPGRAIRLWRAEQTAALPKHAPPEILNADLSTLVLELADWGVNNAADLKWINHPPAPALAEAKNLLFSLGAIGKITGITSHGKAIRSLALPPRLAHMVLQAAGGGQANTERAALLALLVQERGVGGNSADLAERLENAGKAGDRRTQNLQRLAKSIAARAGAASSGGDDKSRQSSTRQPTSGDSMARDPVTREQMSAGVLLGFAFADRIAQSRGQGPDGTVRFRLANGRGAQIDASDPLSREDFLVVVDMAGRAGAARILSAAGLSKSELLTCVSDGVLHHDEAEFDPKSGKLEARRITKFGALTLGKPIRIAVDDDTALTALLKAVRQHGLSVVPWGEGDRKLRGQLGLLHGHMGDPWPDVSDTALLDNLQIWLAPFLAGEQSLACLEKGRLSDGLLLLAGHPPRSEIDRLTPSHFDAPSGSRVPIEYQVDGGFEGDDNQQPEVGRAVLRIRPQELFGLDVHPSILGGTLPIHIELLSPAGRAIQITQDLPGFWRGTWADMRSDMRGRYPKHPWPEDPLDAQPTKRIKPRKS